MASRLRRNFVGSLRRVVALPTGCRRARRALDHCDVRGHLRDCPGIACVPRAPPQHDARARMTRSLCAAFLGTGEVAHSRSDIAWDDLLASGPGVRYALSRSHRLNLGLDYAFATNSRGGAYYFRLGEAF